MRSDLSPLCRRISYRFLLGTACFALSPAYGLAQTQAPSQAANAPDVRTGTLVEVAKQGRIQSLRYTDDTGAEQTLLINAKMRVEVEAEGDAAFLQPGQFIATIATLTNKQLFSKDVSVFLFEKGRAPMGRIVKAPPQTGQSKNAYQVTGVINAIGPDADYPDYQKVDLKTTGPRAPLMLEKGVKVTVKSPDLSLAPVGSTIELTGRALPNGRFNAIKVSIKRDEPLKAAEVLGDGDEAAVGEGAEAAEGAGAAEGGGVPSTEK